MIGVLDTCECGREFLRGIYPQKKCPMCDAMKDKFIRADDFVEVKAVKVEDKHALDVLINADCCTPWEPKRTHKWVYFGYERWCRVCERIEFFWDKIWKACNPPKQANSIVKEERNEGKT